MTLVCACARTVISRWLADICTLVYTRAYGSGFWCVGTRGPSRSSMGRGEELRVGGGMYLGVVS